MPGTKAKSDLLFAAIKRDILELRLAPGAPLRLPALSERYGEGQTPLRDCLQRLTADRLVVMEHNKGFRVAPVSFAELLDLERSRAVIEGALFAEATGRADPTWEARVVGTFHHLKNSREPSILMEPGALETWTARHADFHLALIGEDGTGWLHRFSATLAEQLQRYHRFIQQGLRDLSARRPERAQAAAAVFARAMALEPHEALFKAALSRDPARAAAEFAAHSRLSTRAFDGLTALFDAPEKTELA